MRLWTLLLCGCIGNVTEDNYVQKYSPEYCQKTRRCNLGYFESEWSDMNDCIDEVIDDMEDLIDKKDDDNCDFEDDNALKCLETLGAADCEDYFDGDAFEDCGANKVWDC